MVNVVLRVQSRQRQSVEGGREVPGAHTLPEHTAPAQVVVRVEVAAAERRGRELQVPEDAADDYRADDEERHAASEDRRQNPSPLARSSYRSLLGGYAPAFDVLHDSSVPCRRANSLFTPEIEQTKITRTRAEWERRK